MKAIYMNGSNPVMFVRQPAGGSPCRTRWSKGFCSDLYCNFSIAQKPGPFIDILLNYFGHSFKII